MGFPAGRQLAVHHDASDPDALLTSGLADGVEARTEQQLTEHLLDAALWNAGTVVLGLQFDDVLLVVDLRDLDANLRKNTGLFASVQRVVNGFFDGGDEGTGEGVKSEEVLVLLKKL